MKKNRSTNHAQLDLFNEGNLLKNKGGDRIVQPDPLQQLSARFSEELSISQCCRCPNKGAIFVYAGEHLCQTCWRKVWDSLPYSKRGY